jgi:hypothetical protein
MLKKPLLIGQNYFNVEASFFLYLLTLIYLRIMMANLWLKTVIVAQISRFKIFEK